MNGQLVRLLEVVEGHTLVPESQRLPCHQTCHWNQMFRLCSFSKTYLNGVGILLKLDGGYVFTIGIGGLGDLGSLPRYDEVWVHRHLFLFILFASLLLG